jgi:antitoxin VapB
VHTHKKIVPEFSLSPYFRLDGLESDPSVWLDGNRRDSYHMIYTVWRVAWNMTRSTKKHRSQSGKAASRPAVAEAKVFMTGRSQAVRLPKEYRVTGDSVYVKRLGNSIVLIPKTSDRWAGLFAALDEFPRDFVLERRQDQTLRADLDKLFDKATE